jgi:sugar lactone lactonase YvrE
MRRCSAVLSVLAAVLSPLATAGATQIYWSTGFGQSIERANVDGTGREAVTHTPNLSVGVALDVAHGQVYWTGVQGRGIWRSSLDGIGATKLVAPAGDPHTIKLDVDAGKMYWTEQANSNRVMRANLDGTGAETLITMRTGYPEGLALDLTHDQMYWINIETSAMFRSNLDGTGTVQVLKTGVSPIDLALDLAGGKMYWTENGQNNCSVRRANLDGSEIETIVTGLWNPLGIALDVRARKMYWADHGQGKIQRANLDGTGVETVISTYGPEFIALDVPEPASLALLAVGGIACLWPRRARRRWAGRPTQYKPERKRVGAG